MQKSLEIIRLNSSTGTKGMLQIWLLYYQWPLKGFVKDYINWHPNACYKVTTLKKIYRFLVREVLTQSSYCPYIMRLAFGQV